jgi:ketosteroid isomerase-like protein
MSRSTEATINAFNEAFGRHDVDAVMALMTDDCIFENTLPPPDGERHVGQAAVRKFWQEFFTGTPQAKFEAEEMVVVGDRATVLWRFDWGDGHVRGIDLFKVRDGKVAEKLSYVKG